MGQIKNDQLLIAIRQVLKELRAKTNLVQGHIITDISDSNKVVINLGRIETTGNVTTPTLFVLCEYYGISLSDFFARVEEIDKGLKIKKKK